MMSIDEEIFYQYQIDPEKLIQYGFKPNGNKLIYATLIFNEKFQIIIEYDGKIKGKMIEVENNEEYTNYRLKKLGEFNSKIKNEFIKVLIDVKEKCADRQLFQSKQTKRINRFIYQKYGVSPEFLWEKLPNYCVYRAHTKWFGLIGNVSRNKIDKNSNSKEEVEILNVKVKKKEIDKLLNQKGYYKAYHMNKRNWISIILDETVTDKEIQQLICNSYENIK